MLRERKRVFEDAGLAASLAEQTRLEAERAIWEAAQRRLDSLEGRVGVLRAVPESAPAMPALFDPRNPEIVKGVQKALDDADATWERLSDELAAAITTARAKIEKLRTKWDALHAAQGEELRKAIAPLEDEYGAAAVKEYLALGPRIAQLEADETQANAKRKELGALGAARNEGLANLREARRQIFLVRQAQAQKLNDGLGSAAQIAVTHQGDRRSALTFLRNLKTGAPATALEQLVSRDDFSLIRLAELIRDGDAAELSKVFELSAANAERLISGTTETEVAQMEVVEIPDRVDVSLNVGTAVKPEYRPLDRLSAGGRSTAILLLALLEGDAPLLLDQPEDDLDNRFIYTDVVQRLRQAKEERQFIVATHNANIPVLGDAEHIVVLEVSAVGSVLRGKSAVRGSIDDEELRGPVESVLEGGREAFERRKNKYSF